MKNIKIRKGKAYRVVNLSEYPRKQYPAYCQACTQAGAPFVVLLYRINRAWLGLFKFNKEQLPSERVKDSVQACK